jgi:hypothetical protein
VLSRIALSNRAAETLGSSSDSDVVVVDIYRNKRKRKKKKWSEISATL